MHMYGYWCAAHHLHAGVCVYTWASPLVDGGLMYAYYSCMHMYGNWSAAHQLHIRPGILPAGPHPHSVPRPFQVRLCAAVKQCASVEQ